VPEPAAAQIHRGADAREDNLRFA